jgi:hypothetical protein
MRSVCEHGKKLEKENLMQKGYKMYTSPTKYKVITSII